MPILLKNKSNRAIPVGLRLSDEMGPVTDLDIVSPPVISVAFISLVTGEIPPESRELLRQGAATDDNVFQYDVENDRWFNVLSSKPYTAPGNYTVTALSGDDLEYTIDNSNGACTQIFERLD